ncbi:anaphase promoting complex subunit cdc16 [Ascosphaera pollenicola]|nr:anaphase promoting complex subunit cdc16 [Ascosphaera pollenicola]
MTVSVCTNLRYADLPHGFFTNDRSSQVLRKEMEAQCPNLRSMKYGGGAESMFASQIMKPPTLDGRSGCTWPKLEWLELENVKFDAATLRSALPNLPMLANLKLVDLPWLDDGCLRPLPGYSNFPAVESLTIVNAPGVTWKGLVAALSAAPQTQGQQPPLGMKIPLTSQRPALRLKELRLENTGVAPHTIAHLFRHMPKIKLFSMVQEDVVKPFPLDSGGETIPIPPLFSGTLRTLHYEVSSPPSPPGMTPPSETYYAYLVSSIMAKGFPALRELYVRDNKFPNALLTAPAIVPGTNPRMSLLPPPGVGSSAGDRSSLNMVANPTVDKPLEIYSKNPDELEWNFTAYNPQAARGARATETRPVSFFGASLGPAWGGEGRKSMIVGNGFGGYLAVPVEEGDMGGSKRPGSSSGWSTKSERMDMWR